MEISSCVHRVTRIEVEPVEGRKNTIWRQITFITEVGDYTIAAFPAGGDKKRLAIKFVKGE